MLYILLFLWLILIVLSWRTFRNWKARQAELKARFQDEKLPDSDVLDHF